MPAGGIWNTLSSNKEPLVISNYSGEMRKLLKANEKLFWTCSQKTGVALTFTVS